MIIIMLHGSAMLTVTGPQWWLQIETMENRECGQLRLRSSAFPNPPLASTAAGPKITKAAPCTFFSLSLSLSLLL